MRILSKRNWAYVFLAFAIVIVISLAGNTGFAATQLGNGVPVTSLSGSEDSVQEFEITVTENIDLPDNGTYDQKGTTIMNNRYIRHEYWR